MKEEVWEVLYMDLRKEKEKRRGRGKEEMQVAGLRMRLGDLVDWEMEGVHCWQGERRGELQ